MKIMERLIELKILDNAQKQAKRSLRRRIKKLNKFTDGNMKQKRKELLGHYKKGTIKRHLKKRMLLDERLLLEIYNSSIFKEYCQLNNYLNELTENGTRMHLLKHGYQFLGINRNQRKNLETKFLKMCKLINKTKKQINKNLDIGYLNKLIMKQIPIERTQINDQMLDLKKEQLILFRNIKKLRRMIWV